MDRRKAKTSPQATPFLKWMGVKKSLLPGLLKSVPIIMAIIALLSLYFYFQNYNINKLSFEQKLKPLLNITFDPQKQYFILKNVGPIQIVDINIRSLSLLYSVKLNEVISSISGKRSWFHVEKLNKDEETIVSLDMNQIENTYKMIDVTKPTLKPNEVGQLLAFQMFEFKYKHPIDKIENKKIKYLLIQKESNKNGFYFYDVEENRFFNSIKSGLDSFAEKE